MHRVCATVKSVKSKFPSVFSRVCSNSNNSTTEFPGSADVVIIGIITWDNNM